MAQAKEVAGGDGVSAGILPPIVINLGKTRRKRIKLLQRGRGKLVDEVRQAVDEVRASFGEEMQDKECIPVVLIYREKRRRGRGALRDGLLSFL